MMAVDVHALVGAYALDALDELERAAFERHVADCLACRTEVDELRETAARLADRSWSVPPPRLRTDVMAAIGRTRQVAPPEQSAPGVVAGPSRARRYAVAVAAAVVLAAGTGATVYAIQDQRVREQSALAAAAQLRETRTEAILSASDLVVRSGPITGGGRVTVASSREQAASVVSFSAAQAPPAGHTFQMWTIRGAGAPVSAGLMGTGVQSAIALVDGLPGNDVFAVSLEPAAGAATPSQVVAKVSLT
ncbi:anti-sigma factor domain-containing protein [Actinoplanes sp. NPDC051859]|uniref:anti-sigma factor n=1 Tax=Actinoplanes sp. NPDC051859 TaxID=3363909 RepID=UPI003795BE95